MNDLYPIFIKLAGRRCLVVGGGRIAADKVRGLRDAGAVVTVVSPSLGETLDELARAGLVRWIEREFREEDLDGAYLVIVATDDPAVSAAVFHEAERRGILCNAVDVDEFCSFHVPAIASRGDIKVAISTAGRSPAFAGHLKRRIQKSLTPADETFVKELGRMRPHVLERWADDPDRRKRIFQALVDGYAGDRGETAAALPAELRPAQRGTAYLVGAGPGDAGLLTVRGLALLRSADIVFHDRLVGPGVLAMIPEGVEQVYVGKEAGRAHCEDTGAAIVAAARRGLAVVRLKGGDPLLFGRGGDEMLALWSAGVPFEVVSGVSALTAVPAAAGIPVTFRRISHQVVIRSGYRNPDDPSPELVPPFPSETTYVYFMTAGRLTEIVRELRERDGLADETPVAIIQRGTLPDQRVLHGTVGTIIDLATRSPLRPPAMVVAGAVVRFLERDVALAGADAAADRADHASREGRS